jgi:hypothetical protein
MSGLGGNPDIVHNPTPSLAAFAPIPTHFHQKSDRKMSGVLWATPTSILLLAVQWPFGQRPYPVLFGGFLDHALSTLPGS